MSMLLQLIISKKNYPSIHPLFGRDRFDKCNKTANIEEIQHLHVREEYSIWEDEQGKLFQWDCTSDTHLIYSYLDTMIHIITI